MTLKEAWQNPTVRTTAFIVAIVLILGAHKISLEASIG